MAHFIFPKTMLPIFVIINSIHTRFLHPTTILKPVITSIDRDNNLISFLTYSKDQALDIKTAYSIHNDVFNYNVTVKITKLDAISKIEENLYILTIGNTFKSIDEYKCIILRFKTWESDKLYEVKGHSNNNTIFCVNKYKIVNEGANERENVKDTKNLVKVGVAGILKDNLSESSKGNVNHSLKDSISDVASEFIKLKFNYHQKYEILLLMTVDIDYFHSFYRFFYVFPGENTILIEKNEFEKMKNDSKNYYAVMMFDNAAIGSSVYLFEKNRYKLRKYNIGSYLKYVAITAVGLLVAVVFMKFFVK